MNHFESAVFIELSTTVWEANQNQALRGPVAELSRRCRLREQPSASLWSVQAVMVETTISAQQQW